MEEKYCCFAGHHDLSYGKIQQELKETLIRLVEEENVTHFWVGNYGNFDRTAAYIVQQLKPLYPEIKLVLILPYLTKEINEEKEYYEKNFDLLLMADIPPSTPRRFWIEKANEYMIKHCDFLVCYVGATWGGAYKTLTRARRKKEMKMINLYKR